MSSFFSRSIYSCLFVVMTYAGLAQVNSQITTITISDQHGVTAQSPNFPYDLRSPQVTMRLEDELKEISGLSLCPVRQKMYAIEDETGVLYEMDKSSGKIETKTKFYKDGDYEGIEIVGPNAYVVKSTGTIYEVENFNTDQQKTTKYNSFLEKGDNIEGLAFDLKHNRLLLPCKGFGYFTEKTDMLQKPIFGFDLNRREVDPIPVFILELKAMQSFLKDSKSVEEIIDDFHNFFESNITELPFSPSAIAIHPVTGNIYILSSKGKLLLVIDETGTIQYIEKLKKKVHRQPEGITFQQDGTLYISNEGKDGQGSIHLFPYHNK